MGCIRRRQASEPLLTRLGPAKQIALVDDIGRTQAQEVGLGARLYALGHYTQAKVAGNRQNALYQHTVVGVGGRVVHKRPVNLDLLYR